MSFDPRFDARWNNVLSRAISAVSVGDTRLTPHRVDLRIASDSILTEILDSIARCRIFIGDITAIGELHGKAIRNANVLYEVGIAHAVRQPEEVILLRSDDGALGFDIANVRVHRYDPDGSPEAATRFVGEKIIQAFNEVDQKKALGVRRAVEVLDYSAWMVLAEGNNAGAINYPAIRTMGQVLGGIARTAAISKLLEMSALKAEFVRPTEELLKLDVGNAEELIKYRVTPFGMAILEAAAQEQGFFDPQMRQLLDKYVLGDGK